MVATVVSHTIANLILPDTLRTLLQAWALNGYPREVCGLLLGTRSDAAARVAKLTQARNLNTERARDRFLLDPQDFLIADTVARVQGLDVIGVWHTHPDHAAQPSQTDLQQAWPAWSYVIVAARRDGSTEVRSWRLDDAGQFCEETIREEVTET